MHFNALLSCRNLLPAYSPQEVENAAPVMRPNLPKGKIKSLRERRLATAMKMDVLYTPRVYRAQVGPPSEDGNRNIVRFLPSGQQLGETEKISSGDTRKSRYIYRRFQGNVKSLDEKIKSLRFLIKCLSENGVRDKRTHRMLKRIYLVGFTTRLSNLKKMVCNVVRRNGFRYDRTRNQMEVYTLPLNPCLRQENKSIVIDGVRCRLWHQSDLYR